MCSRSNPMQYTALSARSFSSICDATLTKNSHYREVAVSAEDGSLQCTEQIKSGRSEHGVKVSRVRPGAVSRLARRRVSRQTAVYGNIRPDDRWMKLRLTFWFLSAVLSCGRFSRGRPEASDTLILRTYVPVQPPQRTPAILRSAAAQLFGPTVSACSKSRYGDAKRESCTPNKSLRLDLHARFTDVASRSGLKRLPCSPAIPTRRLRY